jgi:two-component system cell cycle response regulator DivK
MSHAVIIDDNGKNIEVLARLLSMQDISCTRVSRPSQLDGALHNVDEVDVVFLDLEMPGMSGYDILEKLKADSRFQSVPIVAYTVHISEIGVAHRQGFHSFLGKPLDADKFPEQLARILNGQPVWENP